MGYKLIILLALLAGVLYGLHILAKDFQAITSASKFFRGLFKRDLNAQNNTIPRVRWKNILLHDPIQCARKFYCELANQPASAMHRGFAYMLKLEPFEEDMAAFQAFNEAYNYGRLSPEETSCKKGYPLCPFNAPLLFQIMNYLLRKS